MVKITKYIFIPLFIIISFLFSSCRCKKEIIREIVKDSTNTEVIVRVEKEIDTIYVELPSEEKERTTKDSSSFLENKYATSLAKVDTNGSLFHNLISKNINVPVKVEKEYIYRDSTHVVYQYKEKEVPIEVEKKLTLWQTLSLKSFPWLLTAFLMIMVYLFRNPMIKLFRRIFSNIITI